MVLEYISDWWENEKAIMPISEEESKLFLSLNEKDIYEHLKASIGKVTPSGTTKFVPRYEVGDLSISVQFAYYLWSKRYDVSHSLNNMDNSPITEEEFYKIVGDSGESSKLLDVKVEYKGVTIYPATQATITRLVSDLRSMPQD
jgi:hypothetical protein